MSYSNNRVQKLSAISALIIKTIGQMKTALCIVPFVTICLFVSCRGGSGSGNDTGDNNNTPPPVVIAHLDTIKVNVYIENSFSMDGYINGQTAFKDAIREMLVMLKYHYDERNIKVYFINSAIHPTPATINLANFANDINMYWYVGNQANSRLDEIFKMVLAQTNNQTISILFSDYIYSISGVPTNDLLSSAKILTKDAFLSKWRDDQVPLSTTIVKLESKFNGRYYPSTSGSFQIGMERPYYICVFANQEILHDFNRKITLEAGRIEGYKNKYVLSSEDPKSIYWSVLNSSFNIGRFKPDKELSDKKFIRGIQDVRLMSRGVGCTRGNTQPLIFAVAVDFSQIQAEDSYICDPVNYTVTTGNFTVTEVCPIDTCKSKISANDWNTIQEGKPTHIVVLEGKSKQIADVTFLLKKQIPQWIYQSSTEDDSSVAKLNGTTFGLKYWVEGIAEAYETIYPDRKNYFECSISIK